MRLGGWGLCGGTLPRLRVFPRKGEDRGDRGGRAVAAGEGRPPGRTEAAAGARWEEPQLVEHLDRRRSGGPVPAVVRSSRRRRSRRCERARSSAPPRPPSSRGRARPPSRRCRRARGRRRGTAPRASRRARATSAGWSARRDRHPRVQRRVRPQRQPVHGDPAPVDADARARRRRAAERAADSAGGAGATATDTSRAATRRARSRRASPRGSRCSPGRPRVGPFTRAAASGSIGRAAGFRSTPSSSPPRFSSDRTARTCTGSPLCEEHITAISRSVTGPSIEASETAACNGFMHERANATRSGSPTDASSAPDASHTATSPRCTDSTTPERTTSTSGNGHRPAA